MSKQPSVVAALLLGAVLGGAATLALAWPRLAAVDPVPVVPSAGDAAPGSVEAAAARAQLDRIEHAVRGLASSVDSLDGRVRRLAEQQATRSAPPGAPSPMAAAPLDEATLQRAMQEALASEAKRHADEKYRILGNDELSAEVARLAYDVKDPQAAREALDRLLARELDDATRARALIQLGVLQRSSNDVAGSERTLRGVVASRGLGSEEGDGASYQLVWTVWKRDRTEALGIADGLARDAGSDSTRLSARWMAAMLADELGNRGRARTDYEALLRECAGNSQHDWLAADVKKRLAALDGR